MREGSEGENMHFICLSGKYVVYLQMMDELQYEVKPIRDDYEYNTDKEGF